MIRPIETRYAGCRFRSRLEARWAVFFDHLGIEWQYEPQGYLVGGSPYLPDFLLRSGENTTTWVEVRGDEDRVDLEALRAAALELPGDGTLLLLLGPIPRPAMEGDWGWVTIQHDPYGSRSTRIDRYGFGCWPKVGRPWYLDNADGGTRHPLRPTLDRWERGDAQDAYAAARSARFEHGESGA